MAYGIPSWQSKYDRRVLGGVANGREVVPYSKRCRCGDEPGSYGRHEGGCPHLTGYCFEELAGNPLGRVPQSGFFRFEPQGGTYIFVCMDPDCHDPDFH